MATLRKRKRQAAERSATELATGAGQSGDLVGPQLVRVEAFNTLRRLELSDSLPPEESREAFQDLVELRITQFPLRPFADRIWELRRNVTAYEAWYVAIAGSLHLPLATLDRRLARADGPVCEILTPD